MNIYVENIPASATEEEVKQLFTPYGRVDSVVLIKNKKTGLPEGAAYVVMPSAAEAEHALACLEGSEYGGQLMHVREADGAEVTSYDYW